VVKIANDLVPEQVAQLLCFGLIVYDPLSNFWVERDEGWNIGAWRSWTHVGEDNKGTWSM